MAKPEWGTKRVCLSCSARFYDLNHDPIVCPACGAPYDPMAQIRPRRARAQVAKVAAVAPDEGADLEEVAVEIDEEVELEPEEDETIAAEEADEEEEEEADTAIEDVSELGVDEDDMADVIDTEIEEDEAER